MTATVFRRLDVDREYTPRPSAVNGESATWQQIVTLCSESTIARGLTRAFPLLPVRFARLGRS